MKTKINLLITVFVISYSITNGQSLKDYFIPSEDNNLSVYFLKEKGSDFKVKIRYITFSDSVFRIDRTIIFQDINIINSVSKIVKISDNTAKILDEIFFNNLTGKEDRESYDPPIIWLQMPLPGQTTNWSDNDLSKYKAEWTTVSLNNVQKKAIKVTKQTFKEEKLILTSFYYYVEGIGYWKQEILNGSIESIFEILDYQEHVSSIK